MATGTKQQSGDDSEDAIALLTADHEKVKELFQEFEALTEDEDEDTIEQKGEIANQICMELTIHAQLEEEIFYPAVRQAIDEDDLIDEAEAEHASAKELIAEIESMEPDDELYDSTVIELSEAVTRHVEEEQGEIFPRAKKAKLDLAALGQRLAERKEELQADMGMDELGEEEDENE